MARKRPPDFRVRTALPVPPVESWRLAILAAWTLLLLVAPPASNLFWGVNGLRTVAPAAALALLACAGLAAGLPRVRPGRWASVASVALIAGLAFALRETAHWLGDTGVRLGAITMYVHRVEVQPLARWAEALHASPLDFAVNFLAPAALARTGLAIEQAVSLVTFAIGLAYVAGAARVVGRLHAPTSLRPALTAALILAGTLALFAGYAESGGLALAVAAWWWGDLVAPLRTRRDAARMAAWWFVLFLSHRIAWLMLLPMAWRCLGPVVRDDRPEVRRDALLFTLACAAAAAVLAVAPGGSGQIGTDVRDILGGGLAAITWSSPADVLNLLLLIAPLAFVGAVLSLRRPDAPASLRAQRGLVWIAALPLIPLMWILPVAPSGLGVQRDWDLNTLLGWTLSLAGLLSLLRLPETTQRRALTWILPGLVLTAGGWIAVHADDAATLRRAETFVAGPPPPNEPQLAHALLWIGRWRESKGDRAGAASAYAGSYDRIPTPNRGMLAVRMFAEAGHMVDARRMIERIRTRGGLDSSTTEVLDGLESQLDAIEHGAP